VAGTDVSSTVAGLDALLDRVKKVVPDIVSELAGQVQGAARVFAPVGTPGASTNPPGDLAASIRVFGPVQTGPWSWGAFVTPTVRSRYDFTTNYGRIRELGGFIQAINQPYLKFQVFGHWVQVPAVDQMAHPYMRPAREEVAARAYDIASDRVAVAVATPAP
jgi:hypothetical protein